MDRGGHRLTSMGLAPINEQNFRGAWIVSVLKYFWLCHCWHACSQEFTRVAIYFVVQTDFSRWKEVCCGKLTLHWTLDRWQWPSRWANHTITRQQCINWVWNSAWRLRLHSIFNCCREIGTKVRDRQTHTMTTTCLCSMRHIYVNIILVNFSHLWCHKFKNFQISVYIFDGYIMSDVVHFFTAFGGSWAPGCHQWIHYMGLNWALLNTISL